jgi:Protein of unknown function (DUF2867)
MKPAAVRAVPVPGGGVAARTFADVDYADSYAVDLAPDISVRTFAHALLASPPRWIARAMSIRNAVVRPLGLIATRAALERAAAAANGSGERIGIFPVLVETPDEVVLGLDDRHLDFRLSVRVIADQGGCLGVVTTLVRFHGALGRVYFVPVRPAHRLIVPAMVRRAALHLADAQRQPTR